MRARSCCACEPYHSLFTELISLRGFSFQLIDNPRSRRGGAHRLRSHLSQGPSAWGCGYDRPLLLRSEPSRYGAELGLQAAAGIFGEGQSSCEACIGSRTLPTTIHVAILRTQIPYTIPIVERNKFASYFVGAARQQASEPGLNLPYCQSIIIFVLNCPLRNHRTSLSARLCRRWTKRVAVPPFWPSYQEQRQALSWPIAWQRDTAPDQMESSTRMREETSTSCRRLCARPVGLQHRYAMKIAGV